MQITFDTATATHGDAQALRALLAVVFPEIFGFETVRGPATGSAVAALAPPTAVEAFAAEPEAAAVFAQPVTPMPSEAGVPFAGTAPETGGSTMTPPSVPAPAAATALSPAEVDSKGVPWDARIHTGTKTKNKDGSWRQKRDLDPTILASVTAELQASMAAPAAAVEVAAPVPPAASSAPTPPAPPATPAAAPVPPVPSAPAAPEAGAAPAPPVPTAPAPAAVPVPPVPTAPASTATSAPAANPGAEFARIMQAVSAAQTAGKVDTAAISAIVTGLGLPNLAGLLTRADLIPSFEAQFNALMGA